MMYEFRSRERTPPTYARKRAEENENATFEYLQNFDVEDVDLRRSPTGGWHGTYLNKLAYGVDDPEIEGPMPEVSVNCRGRSTTHNSVADEESGSGGLVE